jgi:ABC-type branched-subunit amino acid transport system substrate-binding protein
MFRLCNKKFLTAFFLVFFSLSAFAKTNICYISSNLDAILPRANDLPLQYSGFVQAFKPYNDKIEFKVYQDNRTNSIIYSKPWLTKNNCNIAVGIVSSKDSLLVGPILKSLGIFGMSPTAVTKEADKFKDVFRSLSISSKQYVDDVVAINRDSRLIVIHDPKDIFSQNIVKFLKPSSKIIFHKIDSINFDEIQKDDTIFYTTYPFASIPSLIKFKALSKSKKIIGNPAWGETHTFAKIKSKLPHDKMYFLSPFWKSELSPSAEIFRSKYKAVYGKDPDYDSYYDYDVAGFIISCLKEMNWNKDIDLIKTCLLNKTKFEGITATYIFNQDEAHPKAKQELRRLL